MKKIDFEMQREIQEKPDNYSWIAIWARVKEKQGIYFTNGYQEQCLETNSIIIPKKDKELMQTISYGDVFKGDMFSYRYNGKYIKSTDMEYKGKSYEFLAFKYKIDTEEELFIIPDFLVSLRLKKEKESWVSPNKDYEDVIRISKDSNGKIYLVEVKSEYLKDYLCACKSELLVYSYRHKYFAEKDNTLEGVYEKLPLTIENDTVSLHANIQKKPAGLGWKPEEGADPSDIFFFSSRLWKKDWISAGKKSHKVLLEKETAEYSFVIDKDGNTAPSAHMEQEINYLWFDSKIITDIMAKRGGFLDFYTKDTGNIAIRGSGVHFGVNSIGLINVFAKDISLLPKIQQKIWSAHSITRDGELSKELFASQMLCDPANTIAPEKKIYDLMNEINNKISSEEKLFKIIPSLEDFIKNVNRFISRDFKGLCSLGSGINKAILESINMSFLKNTLTNKPKENLKSLKLLEMLIEEKKGDKTLISVLFNVYDIRILEAHHVSIETQKETLKKINAEEGDNFINIGENLLNRIVFFLEDLKKIL